MGADDVRDGIERELLAGDTEELRDNETNSGQHSGTAVLQFGLTEPWEPLGGTLQKKR